MSLTLRARILQLLYEHGLCCDIRTRIIWFTATSNENELTKYILLNSRRISICTLFDSLNETFFTEKKVISSDNSKN